jgi:hypothetical protein
VRRLHDALEHEGTTVYIDWEIPEPGVKLGSDQAECTVITDVR